LLAAPAEWVAEIDEGLKTHGVGFFVSSFSPFFFVLLHVSHLSFLILFFLSWPSSSSPLLFFSFDSLIFFFCFAGDRKGAGLLWKSGQQLGFFSFFFFSILFWTEHGESLVGTAPYFFNLFPVSSSPVLYFLSCCSNLNIDGLGLCAREWCKAGHGDYGLQSGISD
jgi:hypothetical protein